MYADMFRHFYNYHFAENRKIWNYFITPLTQELFIQDADYSIGSVRNQVVHLMSVDNAWFSGLRGLDDAEDFDPADFEDREIIRAQWDSVEQTMRDYLAELQDNTLFAKPFTYEEDQDLMVWQVLLQVVNHGTDHRAQLLRLLNDLGVETPPQDYIFYVYNNL